MTKYFFIYAYVQYVCSNYCRVNYSSLNHDGNEHVLVLLWCIFTLFHCEKVFLWC